MRAARLATIAALGLCGLPSNVQADPTGPDASAPNTAADEAEADVSAWRLPKLPVFKSELSGDWYPDAARRQALEGRVLLAFDIGADGHAQNISVIWAESGVFAASAEKMLKSGRFSVPSSWAASGAFRRWRIGFVFRLSPSCQSELFAIPVEKIVITGSRLHPDPKMDSGTYKACQQFAPH